MSRRVIRGRSFGPRLGDRQYGEPTHLVSIGVSNVDDVNRLADGVEVELRVIERRAGVLSEIGVHLDDVNSTSHEYRADAIGRLRRAQFVRLADLIERYWEAEE